MRIVGLLPGDAMWPYFRCLLFFGLILGLIAPVSADFFETWQSVEVSPHPGTRIEGDAGTWSVGAGGHGVGANGILSDDGNHYLELRNIGYYAFEASSYAEFSFDVGGETGLPILVGTRLSLTQTGRFDFALPSWFDRDVPLQGSPTGDNVHLTLVDSRGNSLVYVFQCAEDYDQHTITHDRLDEFGFDLKIGYHEILLGPGHRPGGHYGRDLFEDFSRVPEFNPDDARVVRMIYEVYSPEGSYPFMAATLDDVAISDDHPSGFPLIRELPVVVEAVLGTSVRIPITVTGEATLVYQWQDRTAGEDNWMNLNDGGSYSDTQTAELVVGMVTVEMADRCYRCEVGNSDGSVISPAVRLDLRPQGASKPIVTRHPKSQTVSEEGTLMVFDMEASGHPMPFFQWQHRVRADGEWIDLKNDNRFYGVNSPALMVSGAEYLADMEFRCVVANSEGRAVSNPATLSVGAGDPPAVLVHPASIQIQAGESAGLTVEGESPLFSTFRWQVRDPETESWRTLPGTETFFGSSTSVWTVGMATVCESGLEFRCLLSNAAGSTGSDPAVLTVVNAPALIPFFVTHPLDRVCAEGETVQFNASVRLGRSPDLQWQVKTAGSMEWTDLADGDPVRGANSASLEIVDVPFGYSGTRYRCVATNSSGRAESYGAVLHVQLAQQFERGFSFQVLDDLPEYATGRALPTVISGDGRVVAGRFSGPVEPLPPYFSSSGTYLFQWGEDEGYSSITRRSLGVRTISNNGSVMGGNTSRRQSTSVSYTSFRWQAGVGWSQIGLNHVEALSADGTIAVGAVIPSSGQFSGGPFPPDYCAFWTERSGVVPLGVDAWPRGFSASGQVVLLDASNGSRWTENAGLEALPGSYPDWFFDGVYALSGDGSTVIGRTSVYDPESDTYLETPVRWIPGKGIQELEDVPSYGSFTETSSVVEGISADGRVLVGYCVGENVFGEERRRAVVWDEEGQPRDLNQVLLDHGIVLGDMILTEVTGVSADSNTMVGMAITRDWSGGSGWVLTGLNRLEVRGVSGSTEVTITSVSRFGGNNLIRFPTQPDHRYQVQFKADPREGDWADLGDELDGDGYEFTVVHSFVRSLGAQFYRVVANQPDRD